MLSSDKLSSNIMNPLGVYVVRLGMESFFCILGVFLYFLLRLLETSRFFFRPNGMVERVFALMVSL